MRRRLRLLAGIACLAAALSPGGAKAGLLGSSVTLTADYPAQGSPFPFLAPVGPVTVGAGVEFPLGSPYPTGSFDITADRIVWDNVIAENYLAAPFNGPEIDFSGAPRIVSVTLDPASTMRPAGFSFTGNKLFINFAGVSAAPGDRFILDIVTADPSI